MKIQKPNPELEKIVKLTGGVIGTHTLPHGEGKLPNSFLSKNGDYIGDYEEALWFLKNNLKVCDDYPHGVAELYEDKKHIGYYGYTHRGGSTFKIGDRLFDIKYKPIAEDYTPEEWKGWEEEYNKAVSDPDESEWWINDIKNDGISRYIPYGKRGKKIIENMEEAKQAAINMSKYLS